MEAKESEQEEEKGQGKSVVMVLQTKTRGLVDGFRMKLSQWYGASDFRLSYFFFLFFCPPIHRHRAIQKGARGERKKK
jgi:hypothetical protein